jgi:hypothetical protein
LGVRVTRKALRMAAWRSSEAASQREAAERPVGRGSPRFGSGLGVGGIVGWTVVWEVRLLYG